MPDIDFELISPSAPQANDAVLVRRGAAAPNSGALTLTADLLNRANHTGTQLAATISDFDSASRAQIEAALIAGTNVTITPSGTGATRQLTIAAAGGGGGGASPIISWLI